MQMGRTISQIVEKVTIMFSCVVQQLRLESVISLLPATADQKSLPYSFINSQVVCCTA